MKNLKILSKDAFDGICLTEKRKQEILATILAKKKRGYFRKIVVACSVVILFLSTLGIVYADEIKDTFESLLIRQEKKNEKNGEEYAIIKASPQGIVMINDSIDMTKLDAFVIEDETYFEIADIEQLFGVKFLKSTLSVNSKIRNDYQKVRDNKIEEIAFTLPNMTNEQPDEVTENGEGNYHRKFTVCDMHMAFKTQFFSKNSKSGLETVAPRGTRTGNIFINKLNITALIIKYEPEDTNILKIWDVIFSDHHIKYTFHFEFHGTDPESELINFFDSLKDI